jgi:hypothetical protein
MPAELKGDDRKIKILVKQNPRREGTDAHRFFEAMKVSKTVGDFKAKYKKDPIERRNAILSMNTSNRQEYVKLG